MYKRQGDDIVIADKRVAEAYMRIMDEMGGVISIQKSLISHNGCCEFAKRFIIDNHIDSKADLFDLLCLWLVSC